VISHQVPVYKNLLSGLSGIAGKYIPGITHLYKPVHLLIDVSEYIDRKEYY